MTDSSFASSELETGETCTDDRGLVPGKLYALNTDWTGIRVS